MGWFGKIAGAVIGNIIAGPIGAAAGAYIGHKYVDSRGEQLSGREQIQANYFVALFSMLGKMAKADGVVTADEIKVVDNLITNTLRFSPDRRTFAIKVFNEAKDSTYSFEDFARNFYQMNMRQPDMLLSMLNTLFEVAKADGQLHPGEERLLQSAQRIFSISDQQYEYLLTRHFPKQNADKHYAVLNCTSQDSDSVIKSSYRKLVQEFHPDKVASQGMPEEFTAYAKDKFQEIQDAYDYIRAERGF